MNAISSRRHFTARSRAWISLIASLTLVAGTWAALGSSPASAATTTTVVSTGDLSPNGPWALEPTSNTGSFGFVSGPATPPSGVGSLSMTIASGQHEWLNNYAYGVCANGPSCNDLQTNWALLSDLDTLSYSTYRVSGSTLPTFNIEADFNGTGTSYTTFVFVPNIGSIVNSTWQTWDATSPAAGTWYSTANTGVGTPFNCAFQSAGCDHTWSEIQSGYPLARVRFGLGPNVGTGGTFTGNVDNFTVGEGANTVIYNFEPGCTTNCYVNTTTGNDLNTGQAADPLKTIQAGANKVASSGTVHVAAGTYVENVTVPTSARITGAGTTTIVRPAVSDPNCGGAGGGSLCAGASNVFLVKASNVTIDHLKIDGDNTSLNTGVNVGGANVDARNGIITDHTTAPCNAVCNGLFVHDVTVQNIFLRGIYASSGGTFNFTNNTVNNVQADPGSIAMFTFLGSGVMTGNHVSNANDGLAANHSQGTTFTNNTVTSSLSGVHTDNAGDSGGIADTISGNHVTCTAGSGAYGVWAFVPYKTPTISSNVVSGCDVGMAALASCNLGGTNSCPGGNVPAVHFMGNNVTTTATAGAYGLYITTDTFNFGDGEVRANGDHNVISGPGKSVFVEETGGETATAAVTRNSLRSLQNTGVTTVNATCNWWGQASGPGGGQVAGPATTSPYLTSSNLNGPCPGPTPPGPPRTVTAKAGNAKATVSWLVPLSNGGSPINGYVVTPVRAGAALPPRTFNSTATTQVITGLTNTVGYYFVVQARNAMGVGAGETSNGAVRVGAPGTPPQPTVTNPAPGSLKVTFLAPAPNGAPITSYTATCKSSNGGVAGSKTGPKSPITVTGLTAGRSYTCRVLATNSRGNGSPSPPSVARTA
jgi:hypothetical protein